MADGRPPYVGPRPFEEDDKALFFGRDVETDELLSLVVAHPVVLFYSRSGSGKSSLLNAGLVPSLRDEGFRLLLGARMSPVRPPDTNSLHTNRFIDSALRAWAENSRNSSNASLSEFLKQIGTLEDGATVPTLVLFDQFEEFFSLGSAGHAERVEFMRDLAQALQLPRLRVVFSMREEALAQMTPYAQLLPGELRIQQRLEPLGHKAAIQAVTRPVSAAGFKKSFDPGAAESLVDKLRLEVTEEEAGVGGVRLGLHVEPVQLQVVCDRLWRKLPQNAIRITTDDIEKIGDVTEALAQFYSDTVLKVCTETGVSEGQVRRWFESVLITPAGTRGTVFRGSVNTGGLPNPALDQLETEHIVRAELRSGSRWYELSHDTFISPIRKSNRAWRERLSEAEQTRQFIEARATQWRAAGSPDELLLEHLDLERAERWLEDPASTELGRTEEMAALVAASRNRFERMSEQKALALERENASRQAADAVRWRRRTLFAYASLCFAIAATVAAALNWAKASRARAIEREALSVEREARKMSERAMAEARKSALAAEQARKVEFEARAQVQRALDELKASNEKLQSTNELLRASKKQVSELASLVPVRSAAPIGIQGLASGIDVSRHQRVDWHATANAGLVFAFVKATEGNVFVDPSFNDSWSNSKKAGLIRGAYHFFRPARNAVEQARNFVNVVRSLEDDDLPPVLDIEEDDGLPIDTVLGNARVWLDEIERAFKRKPVIYSGAFLRQSPAAVVKWKLDTYPFWLASYTKTPASTSPWPTWTFWQYTITGKIDSVQGSVDLNVFNGSRDQLREFIAKTRLNPR